MVPFLGHPVHIAPMPHFWRSMALVWCSCHVVWLIFARKWPKFAWYLAKNVRFFPGICQKNIFLKFGSAPLLHPVSLLVGVCYSGDVSQVGASSGQYDWHCHRDHRQRVVSNRSETGQWTQQAHIFLLQTRKLDSGNSQMCRWESCISWQSNFVLQIQQMFASGYNISMEYIICQLCIYLGLTTGGQHWWPAGFLVAC